jgi:hypothetical protein
VEVNSSSTAPALFVEPRSCVKGVLWWRKLIDGEVEASRLSFKFAGENISSGRVTCTDD